MFVFTSSMCMIPACVKTDSWVVAHHPELVYQSVLVSTIIEVPLFGLQRTPCFFLYILYILFCTIKTFAHPHAFHTLMHMQDRGFVAIDLPIPTVTRCQRSTAARFSLSVSPDTPRWNPKLTRSRRWLKNTCRRAVTNLVVHWDDTWVRAPTFQGAPISSESCGLFVFLGLTRATKHWKAVDDKGCRSAGFSIEESRCCQSTPHINLTVLWVYKLNKDI